MRFIRRTSRVADIMLSILTTALALALLFTSGYILYDNFYKGQHAFISRDLLQYKPDANDAPEMSFKMIREINPDTVAWLTVYGTNIDYPVVQGKDDLEYASKDIYGEQCLTGSIYLSASNSSDISDSYNIIYGHHMDNSAMFGDIDKYADKEYFLNHRLGILTTPEGNYDLNIFACLRTDAYDNLVYYIGNHDVDTTEVLVDYIMENAENYVQVDAKSVSKIMALSTCSDAATNGRMVLFADTKPRMTPVPSSGENTTPVISGRVAEGHGTASKGWALLNLICVVATVLTLAPLTFLKKKYGQLSYAKEKIGDLSDLLDGFKDIKKAIGDDYERFELVGDCVSLHTKAYEELKRFRRKAKIGILLEIIGAIGAIAVFILTEDFYMPMTIRDRYTGLMVGIFAASLLIDYIFLRYRGRKPEQLPAFSDEPALEHITV